MEQRGDFVARFNPALNAEMTRFQGEIAGIADDPAIRTAYARASALAAGGGKRIRPYVASLLFRDAARCETDDVIMPALIAIETFHLFALVHDDIMDDADERYGIPTIHAFIREQEKDRLGLKNADALGRSHAILVGDSLLTLVHDLFFKTADQHDPAAVHAAHRLLITMSQEIVAGQHLDIACTVRPDTTEAQILKRHFLKTALYTFARPMQIGATLGGGSPELLRFCEAFGAAIGVGFQLEDDLLDLLGEKAKTGKTPGIDLTQHQQTLLTLHVAARGTPEQKARLEKLWGQTFDEPTLAEARALFQESGAVDVLRHRAQASFTEAARLLKQSPLQPATAETLGGLVAFLQERLP